MLAKREAWHEWLFNDRVWRGLLSINPLLWSPVMVPLLLRDQVFALRVPSVPSTYSHTNLIGTRPTEATVYVFLKEKKTKERVKDKGTMQRLLPNKL